jgi:hypothetical protein
MVPAAQIALFGHRSGHGVTLLVTVRDPPPRSGWLDELGRLKGGWVVGLGVARCAPHGPVQNCLLADVLSDLLQFRTRRSIPCNRWAERLLAGKVAFLDAQASDGDCALAFQEADHRRDAHMHMVRHQMPFKNLAFLLPRANPWKIWPKLTACLPEDCFLPPFWHEHRMVLASPIWNGRGSGNALTLNPPHRWSSSHLRKIILAERSNLFKSYWSNQWLAH